MFQLSTHPYPPSMTTSSPYRNFTQKHKFGYFFINLMSNRVLAHGVRAVFPVSFESVVNVVRGYDSASNIYFTVLDKSPRTAVALGQKFYFRTSHYLCCMTLVIERGSETEVRIIAHSGLKLSALTDYGASANYALDVLDHLSKSLGVNPRDVVEVDYMDVTKSQLLE
ncbi:hypothetical protein YG5714_0418 [Sulfolobus islandicus Y.G.57.14]|uniref:Uncharacterized protein n=2 Tax=Saccharolobus islandicus TaxID=43080 RepID=C3NA25_SACI7|nr:hypothetical protein YG5714_0418 [Sulfolobus islandicus Y.G.57.14]